MVTLRKYCRQKFPIPPDLCKWETTDALPSEEVCGIRCVLLIWGSFVLFTMEYGGTWICVLMETEWQLVHCSLGFNVAIQVLQ